jgi:hypothetical protein
MRAWTLEERARQRELIAGWSPWQKSTGPKTAEGKQRVKMNAYKGALRATVRQARVIAALVEEDAQLLATAKNDRAAK